MTTFLLTYIDLDGKREIYAPFKNLEKALESRNDPKFTIKRERNPNHDFKFKVKELGVGWVKI